MSLIRYTAVMSVQLDQNKRRVIFAVAASLMLQIACVIALMLATAAYRGSNELIVPLDLTLSAPNSGETEETAMLFAPPPAEAKPFVVQNPLPADFFENIRPEFKTLNALADTEEGGTQLRPEGVRSGGGGGDGADSRNFGHVATDDKSWARLKWKSDPNARLRVAGDDKGRGQSVPGVQKNPGAGVGLGNGSGSGALASAGSGTGAGTGINGSNTGSGLGKAPVSGATKRPEVLSMNRGVYPTEARNARHEGTVVLNVEVLDSGAVGRVEVRTTSGYAELDQAALTAAHDWKFTGALKDGKPVNFWYAIPFNFMLVER